MLLSIIIPTRNRSNLLSSLLDSIARQDHVSFNWEILVIDNGSSDDTAKVVKKKQASMPVKIRYIMEPRPGLHFGRHRGAKEASGRFIGYLDDDMILAPTWVQGVEQLVQGNVSAVVGRILPYWEVDPPT